MAVGGEKECIGTKVFEAVRRSVRLERYGSYPDEGSPP